MVLIVIDTRADTRRLVMAPVKMGDLTLGSRPHSGLPAAELTDGDPSPED